MIDKGFLIIGDSYGTGYVMSGTANTPYTSRVKTLLTNLGYFCDYSCLNGAGFGSDTKFLTALNTWISNNSSNLSKITDVFVFGGANDKASTYSDIQTGMHNFRGQCQTSFPNLHEIHVGFLGFSSTPGDWPGMSNACNYYSYCAGMCGFHLVEGTQYIVHDSTQLQDTLHPNATTQTEVANYICSAMLSGHIHVHDTTTISSFPASSSSQVINYTFTIDMQYKDGIVDAVPSGNLGIRSSWQIIPGSTYAFLTCIPSYFCGKTVRFSGFIGVPVFNKSFVTSELIIPATLTISPDTATQSTVTLGVGLTQCGYDFNNGSDPDAAIGTISGTIHTYFNSISCKIL